MDMKEFKDELGEMVFGIAPSEAICKEICVNCKERVDGRIWTKAGLDEYFISGLCEICFDDIMEEER
jgi:hypothetical protein